MDRPIITIPSYNNPQAKIFDKLLNIKLNKYVFVRKEQYDDYKYLEKKGFNVITIPEDINEIGRTRRYIVFWANKHQYDWAFMFDDDISKVERVGLKPDGSGYNSIRIMSGSKVPPRFENRSLKLWFDLAKKYDLSLSSPNHRAYDRFSHGPNIRINKSAIIQCVLLHVPDVISIGNYRDINKFGNEDYVIQFHLMSQGFKTGKIGLVEFDAPSIGNISDGTNSSLVEKYNRWIKLFQDRVCDDPNLIGTKTTSTGIPSIQFKWKNWNGYTINLKGDINNE